MRESRPELFPGAPGREETRLLQVVILVENLGFFSLSIEHRNSFVKSISVLEVGCERKAALQSERLSGFRSGGVRRGTPRYSLQRCLFCRFSSHRYDERHPSKGRIVTLNFDRNGPPILIDADGCSHSLVRTKFQPQDQPFDEWPFKEKWLQDKIHTHAQCLPIHEIEPGLGDFVGIATEVPTAAGFIDNLLMTANGHIAIVEVKLFRNPEARRQVIAQALDYAATLFGMDYTAFETAVLKASDLRIPKASLYHQFADNPALEEPDFIDAVSANLKRGRILILIAGDGIKAELRGLVEQLDAFAQMRFTLALVEMAVYDIPGGGFLVRPSTLLKTQFVTRTVFDYAPPGTKPDIHTVPADITSDAYWEALSATMPGARSPVESLIDDLQTLGVTPEFRASLNLKWTGENREKPINFAYIQRNGLIWTDLAAWGTPPDIALRYVQALADAWNADVHAMPKGTSWTIYQHGKPIRLSAVLDRLDALPPLIQKFQQELLEVVEA